ncbi:MAG: pyridoxamine 5'-phosphate oxidase [Parvularculaceae bacterium]
MADSPLIPPTPKDADYAVQMGSDADVFTTDEPFKLFEEWFLAARNAEPNDPNAMSLATVDAQGAPNIRIVLLKDFGPGGFTFFTNTQSDKGRELAANPVAALCFHWKSIGRQIRIRGAVAPVSDAEADAYFASRARDARIGAIASAQSRPLASPEAFKAEFEAKKAEFEGREPERPKHWSGYRMTPVEFEFWMNRPYRLHERRRFRREGSDAPWTAEWLYP